jgi:hypothetical protein
MRSVGLVRVAAVVVVGVVAIVAVACKPDVLTVTETYQRDTCACARHDIACVRAAQSKYEDDNGKVVGHWYQRRVKGDELQRLMDGARECHHRIVACSVADPCGAGRACADIRPDLGIGHCVPVVGEGQVCGGWDGDACGDGTWCKMDEITDVMNQPCEVPCPRFGKCVRGAPPSPSASAPPMP